MMIELALLLMYIPQVATFSLALLSCYSGYCDYLLVAPTFAT
jgi:hypothetical protein